MTEHPTQSIRSRLFSFGNWRAKIRDLVRDRRGVAAMEFGFMMPILFAMYFVTIEVSEAIDTSKKVNRIGSMVGYLVTLQQTSVTAAEINGILTIAESTIRPYNRSRAAIEITAIEITDEAAPKTKVVWSRKISKTGAITKGATKDSLTTVPSEVYAKGAFLIRVTGSLDYAPIITWTASERNALGLGVLGRIFDQGVVKMGETYYMRPTRSTKISCTDC